MTKSKGKVRRRRHDYGACDKGGDCRACEREARRAMEEEDKARRAEGRETWLPPAARHHWE